MTNSYWKRIGQIETQATNQRPALKKKTLKKIYGGPPEIGLKNPVKWRLFMSLTERALPHHQLSFFHFLAPIFRLNSWR